jgi:hypothetical protein
VRKTFIMEATTAAPPEAFLCPITHALMVEPVIDPEGNSYERAAIAEWLSRNGTSPVTRAALALRDLAPNRALQHAIESHTRGATASAASLAPKPAAEPVPPTSAAEVSADKGVTLAATVGAITVSCTRAYM